MATKTNKKDWSLVVWVFGWLLSLVTALKKTATRLGVPFEAFERLGSEMGEETLNRVLQLILDDHNASLPKPAVQEGGHPYRGGKPSNGDALPADHYRVHITYAPMPSLADLKKEFGEDNVSDIFDGRPWELHSACADMVKAPGNKTFLVHDVGRDWRGEERIAWGLAQRTEVAPNGYRPATREETYEFAKARPELVDFVGLGSFTMSDDDRYVAGVWRYGSRRILDSDWFDDGWDRRGRVLFVSK